MPVPVPSSGGRCCQGGHPCRINGLPPLQSPGTALADFEAAPYRRPGSGSKGESTAMPRLPSRLLPAAASTGVLLASLAPALAADAPTPNKGDTAWMLTATVLV